MPKPRAVSVQRETLNTSVFWVIFTCLLVALAARILIPVAYPAAMQADPTLLKFLENVISALLGATIGQLLGTAAAHRPK